MIEIINSIKKHNYRNSNSVDSGYRRMLYTGKIGQYISTKIESATWGESAVKELAEFLQHTDPTLKAFSDKNLWQMKLFYEIYRESAKLSPVEREIHPYITNSLKGNYIFEFLGLPKRQSENELQKGLVYKKLENGSY